MSAEPSPRVLAIGAGGAVAEHLPLPAPLARIAPTDAKTEQNVIKFSLVPFACWRAGDLRFAFGSSFVLPEIATEIQALSDLMDDHTIEDAAKVRHKPVLTVFGHADPTGSDDYNKILSGRRAQAIYGLLVRKPELWEDLYSNPLGEDKWEPEAIHTMQRTLGRPEKDRPPASERKVLFKDYMDHLCTSRDVDGKPLLDEQQRTIRLELKTTDFLTGGADPKGKGDFQGCGEFNPILMFSEAENKTFSDPKNKAARDAANAPNRRVLVFLFRPGIRIKPDVWPCPRAKEGVADCKKRLWSDAEQRRKFQERRREFKNTPDTFACRFYDRFATQSPCEAGHETVRVRLFDLAGKAMPKTEFFAEIGVRKIRGVSDKEGDLLLTDLKVPDVCLMRWSRPKKLETPVLAADDGFVVPALTGGDSGSGTADPAPPLDKDKDFEFETTLFLEVTVDTETAELTTGAPAEAEPITRRLHNLGYHSSLSRAVKEHLFLEDLDEARSGPDAGKSNLGKAVVSRHDNLNPPSKATS